MNDSIQLQTIGAVRVIHLTGKPKRANPLSTALMRELLKLADRAGLLRDPDLASLRMRESLSLAGIT
jgi:Protein of unknown function (DUF993)